MAVIVMNPLLKFWADDATVLNGGKLYTYENGTTTPKATYQDAGEVAEHANPIILDTRGEKVVYGSGTYTFVLKTAGDVTIQTIDDVALLTSGAFGSSLLASASAAAARTLLGLGTAAVLDTGTSIGNVVILENVGGNAGMPAVDGSQLTGITASQVTDLDTEQAFHRSYLAGLILSNAGGDPNHDIQVAAGECRDGANGANMILSSAIIKQLDAAWAVGTNQGGLDTGSIASDTWYHVFLIKDPTNDIVDVLFSTSLAAPSMPTNYTKKRRLGSILTDGSGNLLAFSQWGDEFLWDVTPLDIDVVNLGTTAVLYTLDYVPSGVQVKIICNLSIYKAGSTGPTVIVSSPDISNQEPSTTVAPLSSYIAYGGYYHTIGHYELRTNASAQVRARSNIDGTTFKLAVIGWVDRRGRDD